MKQLPYQRLAQLPRSDADLADLFNAPLTVGIGDVRASTDEEHQSSGVFSSRQHAPPLKFSVVFRSPQPSKTVLHVSEKSYSDLAAFNRVCFERRLIGPEERRLFPKVNKVKAAAVADAGDDADYLGEQSIMPTSIFEALGNAVGGSASSPSSSAFPSSSSSSVSSNHSSTIIEASPMKKGQEVVTVSTDPDMVSGVVDGLSLWLERLWKVDPVFHRLSAVKQFFNLPSQVVNLPVRPLLWSPAAELFVVPAAATPAKGGASTPSNTETQTTTTPSSPIALVGTDEYVTREFNSEEGFGRKESDDDDDDDEPNSALVYQEKQQQQQQQAQPPQRGGSKRRPSFSTGLAFFKTASSSSNSGGGGAVEGDDDDGSVDEMSPEAKAEAEAQAIAGLGNVADGGSGSSTLPSKVAREVTLRVTFHDKRLGFSVCNARSSCDRKGRFNGPVLVVGPLTGQALVHGLKVGDRIVAYNGKPLRKGLRHPEFKAKMSRKGRPLALTLIRRLFVNTGGSATLLTSSPISPQASSSPSSPMSTLSQSPMSPPSSSSHHLVLGSAELERNNTVVTQQLDNEGSAEEEEAEEKEELRKLAQAVKEKEGRVREALLASSSNPPAGIMSRGEEEQTQRGEGDNQSEQGVSSKGAAAAVAAVTTSINAFTGTPREFEGSQGGRSVFEDGSEDRDTGEGAAAGVLSTMLESLSLPRPPYPSPSSSSLSRVRAGSFSRMDSFSSLTSFLSSPAAITAGNGASNLDDDVMFISDQFERASDSSEEEGGDDVDGDNGGCGSSSDGNTKSFAEGISGGGGDLSICDSEREQSSSALALSPSSSLASSSTKLSSAAAVASMFGLSPFPLPLSSESQGDQQRASSVPSLTFDPLPPVAVPPACLCAIDERPHFMIAEVFENQRYNALLGSSSDPTNLETRGGDGELAFDGDGDDERWGSSSFPGHLFMGDRAAFSDDTGAVVVPVRAAARAPTLSALLSGSSSTDKNSVNGGGARTSHNDTLEDVIKQEQQHEGGEEEHKRQLRWRAEALVCEDPGAFAAWSVKQGRSDRETAAGLYESLLPPFGWEWWDVDIESSSTSSISNRGPNGNHEGGSSFGWAVDTQYTHCDGGDGEIDVETSYSPSSFSPVSFASTLFTDAADTTTTTATTKTPTTRSVGYSYALHFSALTRMAQEGRSLDRHDPSAKAACFVRRRRWRRALKRKSVVSGGGGKSNSPTPALSLLRERLTAHAQKKERDVLVDSSSAPAIHDQDEKVDGQTTVAVVSSAVGVYSRRAVCAALRVRHCVALANANVAMLSRVVEEDSNGLSAAAQDDATALSAPTTATPESVLCTASVAGGGGDSGSRFDYFQGDEYAALCSFLESGGGFEALWRGHGAIAVVVAHRQRARTLARCLQSAGWPATYAVAHHKSTRSANGSNGNSEERVGRDVVDDDFFDDIKAGNRRGSKGLMDDSQAAFAPRIFVTTDLDLGTTLDATVVAAAALAAAAEAAAKDSQKQQSEPERLTASSVLFNDLKIYALVHFDLPDDFGTYLRRVETVLKSSKGKGSDDDDPETVLSSVVIVDSSFSKPHASKVASILPFIAAVVSDVRQVEDPSSESGENHNTNSLHLRFLRPFLESVIPGENGNPATPSLPSSSLAMPSSPSGVDNSLVLASPVSNNPLLSAAFSAISFATQQTPVDADPGETALAGLLETSGVGESNQITTSSPGWGEVLSSVGAALSYSFGDNDDDDSKNRYVFSSSDGNGEGALDTNNHGRRRRMSECGAGEDKDDEDESTLFVANDQNALTSPTRAPNFFGFGTSPQAMDASNTVDGEERGGEDGDGSADGFVQGGRMTSAIFEGLVVASDNDSGTGASGGGGAPARLLSSPLTEDF